MTDQKKGNFKSESSMVEHLGCFSLKSLASLLGQVFEKQKWKLDIYRGFFSFLILVFLPVSSMEFHKRIS